jgi:plasmid stabilization system protein ParE
VSFTVLLTRAALEDLARLEAFLTEQALQHGDFDLPLRAMDAIQHELRILATNPYTCRKVGTNPLERELVIPFGGAGYVALFEILNDHAVAVAAIRHQRESDYH